jgi:hypothetical protein
LGWRVGLGDVLPEWNVVVGILKFIIKLSSNRMNFQINNRCPPRDSGQAFSPPFRPPKSDPSNLNDSEVSTSRRFQRNPSRPSNSKGSTKTPLTQRGVPSTSPALPKQGTPLDKCQSTKTSQFFTEEQPFRPQTVLPR